MSKTQTRKRRRSYTTIACDFCKDRHRRCSGDKPVCENCKKHQRICIYRIDRFENKKQKKNDDEIDGMDVGTAKQIRDVTEKATLPKERKGVKSAGVTGKPNSVANNVSPLDALSKRMHNTTIGTPKNKEYKNYNGGLYNYELSDSPPSVLGGYGTQQCIESVYKRTEFINSGGYDFSDINVYKSTNTFNTRMTDNGYSTSVIENVYKSGGYHSATERFDPAPIKPVYNNYEDNVYNTLDDFHGAIDYQRHPYPHELSNDSPPPVFNGSGYNSSSSRFDVLSNDMDLIYDSPNTMYSNDTCMNDNGYTSPPLNTRIAHKEYNGSHDGWYDEPYLYREQIRPRELNLLSVKKVHNEKREKEKSEYPYEGGELFKFFVDWKGSSSDNKYIDEEEFRAFR